MALLPSALSAQHGEVSTSGAPAGVVGPTLRFGDYDRDGLADLYAVRPASSDRLFKNLGDGTFVDVTEAIGLAGITGSRLALWQDYDQDGWLDLYIGAQSGPGRLVRNEQGRSFVDVTLEAGVEHRDDAALFAEWLDLDLDGFPDLHVVTDKGDRLFLNERSGHFAEIELPGEADLDQGVIALAAPPPPASDTTPGTSPLSTPGVSPGPTPMTTPGTPPLVSCQPLIRDASTGNCISVASTPAIGALYPLSTAFNIDSSGNVGMGTTSPQARLDVAGGLRGERLVLTETVSPPLVVASTAKVDSLNADLLDGLESSAFSQLGPTIEGAEIFDGTISDVDVSGSAAIAGTKISADFGSQTLVSSGGLDVLGMRTEGSAGTPNVVGGYAGNTVKTGVFGGTIGGGGALNGEHQLVTDFSTIGGGYGNQAGNPNAGSAAATVGGGADNTASGINSTVGGGTSNTASATQSTIGGGTSNTASGNTSTVGGGLNNTATGATSTVGGGGDNMASGIRSMIPGGTFCRALGDYSFAAGSQAKANHHGTFVWADDTNAAFGSTAVKQFLVRAGGGVGINTDAPEAPLHVMESSAGIVTANSTSVAVFERSNAAMVSILAPDGLATGIRFGNPSNPDSGGIIYDQGSVGPDSMQLRAGGNVSRLTIQSSGAVGIATNAPAFTLHVNGSAGKPGGGSWSVASDARLKKNVRDLDGALERLLELRGVTYEYIDPKAIGEPEGERMGMIAQEVERVFPDWVETGPDGYRKLTVRGFEALAVEALRELCADKDAQLQALRAQQAVQAERLESLEERLARLESGAPR